MDVEIDADGEWDFYHIAVAADTFNEVYLFNNDTDDNFAVDELPTFHIPTPEFSKPRHAVEDLVPCPLVVSIYVNGQPCMKLLSVLLDTGLTNTMFNDICLC